MISVTTVKTTTPLVEACEVGMLETFSSADVGSTINVVSSDVDDDIPPSALLYDSGSQYEDSNPGIG